MCHQAKIMTDQGVPGLGAQNKQLSDVAAKRLEAIREYTEFGSGFKIAMRDLEIRRDRVSVLVPQGMEEH